MKPDKLEAFLVGLVIGIIFAGFISSWFNSREVFKMEAVQAGKAEYYLDAKHERQWRWKP